MLMGTNAAIDWAARTDPTAARPPNSQPGRRRLRSNNADRLTKITQGTANVSLTYDTASRRTSLTLPNGIIATYG